MTLRHVSETWTFGQRALGFLNGNWTLDTVQKVSVFEVLHVRIFPYLD